MNTSTNDTTGRLVELASRWSNWRRHLGGFGLNRMVLDRTGLTGSFDIELVDPG